MTGRLCQDDSVTTREGDWRPKPQPEHRVSDDERMIGTTGASTSKRKIADVLGQEPVQNARHGVCKRARLLDATISQREDGSGVALDKRHASRPGHSYSGVYSDGNARVHVGDLYAGTTINHNYFGLCAAMNMRLTQEDIDPAEEAAILRLAAVIIVAAIANVIVQPFLLLRNALHRAIPHAVQRRTTPLSSLFESRMVLFEDALGRFERIDINVVTDWTSFHYNLTRAFADQPGHRRVAVAGYRLFDQAQGTQLIDPRRPPPFASVFVRNKHVRMSIHFAWDEVSLECCPKCGLKQICELERETICKAKACGFSYRGHIKESPIVEVEDDDDDDNGVNQGETPRKGNNIDRRTNLNRRPLKNEQENPAWFSRISVSQQPEEIANRNNNEKGVDSNDSNMLGDDSATQVVGTNVYRSNLFPANDFIQNWDNRGRARVNGFLDDMVMGHGNTTLLPVEYGESQKALHDSGAGLKRRAQSPIARERVASNEQDSPPVWDPSEIFQRWDAMYGLQPKLYPDSGERLQNEPSLTPATFGNVRLNDPFIDIGPRATRPPNSYSEVGQRLRRDSRPHPVAPGAENDTGFDNRVNPYIAPYTPGWDGSLPGIHYNVRGDSNSYDPYPSDVQNS